MKRPTEPAQLVVPPPASRDEPTFKPAIREWRSELTRPLLEELVVAATVGGFKRHCALACGVKPELLEWWLSEGMRADGPAIMQELSVRFQGIQADWNQSLVAVIERAARNGRWEAALALLERRSPEWGGKTAETETAPPKLPQEQRRAAFLAELRAPRGDIAACVLEAREQILAFLGVVVADPMPSGGPGPHEDGQ